MPQVNEFSWSKMWVLLFMVYTFSFFLNFYNFPSLSFFSRKYQNFLIFMKF